MNETLLLVLGLSTLLAVVVFLLRPRPEKGVTQPSTSRRGPWLGSSDGGAQQILERMSEGVLVVDQALRPEYVNPAARNLLGLQPGTLPPKVPSIEMAGAARKAALHGEISEALVDVYYPRRLSLKVHAAPLIDRDGAVLVLQDVSEEVHTQKVRREFVAHASHELKSPVASLQALAEATSDALEHQDLEAASRFSVNMQRETGRLSKLVEDLLDLSRLEEPLARPNKKCDLTALVRKEVAGHEAKAHDAGIALMSNSDEKVTIMGDEQQLSLLVRNLLLNAIQYTPEGGEVRVETRQLGDQAIFRVADTGLGIPLEAQGRVFERFYRVDRARSRDRGGTGLGLAIVKHVTELHGGEVQLHSELGTGSTFTVRFPIPDAKRSPSAGESRNGELLATSQELPADSESVPAPEEKETA